MHRPYHSARHVVCALPICLPVILKSCPLGGLLSRKIEALNPNGLSADGDSPLAPSAQDGLRAELVGVDKAELSGSGCSAMPPVTWAAFTFVGRRPHLPGLPALVGVLSR